MLKIMMIFSFIFMGTWAETNVNTVPQTERIINGNLVSSSDNTWKFIVSLQWNGNHYCGGSLIAPNWVLTAAHCLSDSYGNPYVAEVGDTVAVGSYNLNSMTSYSVKRFVVNSSYNYLTFDNDIGLIELTQNVTNISTINYDTAHTLAPNTQTKVAGWGNMSTTTNDFPTDLQEGLVPIVDFNQCNGSSAYNGQLTSNMMCAGYFVSTRDSCQGDSGGPLMVDNTVVGIVSWGYGCAQDNYPGVYTKVQNYATWIKGYVPKVAKFTPIIMDDILIMVPYQ